MALAIEMQRVEPRPYVGVRRKVTHEGLGALCGDALPRVADWLGSQGLAPEGPPMLVYHGLNRETGEFDAQAGFFVSQPLAGEGDIRGSVTPGGDVLRAVHTGPYNTLGVSWEKMFARAEELGRPVTGSSWEVYLNDPRTAEPARLLTEIWLPLDDVLA